MQAVGVWRKLKINKVAYFDVCLYNFLYFSLTLLNEQVLWILSNAVSEIVKKFFNLLLNDSKFLLYNEQFKPLKNDPKSMIKFVTYTFL